MGKVKLTLHLTEREYEYLLNFVNSADDIEETGDVRRAVKSIRKQILENAKEK